ncbi:SPOR domain-containing protein [Geomobilimonas luticola]|uniref:SPOR domain-containing protein n=1 Tax=Geomobilimonas luticola TaxID=1114878 RepID=A0ABS5SHI5_9BACT|nr:SPOR domain-containing protein [Geomobilimonas luticola]MBT0654046.1 SPOR domain-containing protein [Geomobilimonas luticola]
MFGFRKSSTDEKATDGEKGSSQQILLLVLVLLLAVFGYLYFFTGIIKPRVEAPAPPPPAQVKQPIPARPDAGGAGPAAGNAAAPAAPDAKAAAVTPAGAPATAPSTPAAGTPAAKPVAVPPAPAAAPSAKPAAATPAKPAAVAAAKPAAVAAAKPAAVAAAKPAAKQPAPPAKSAKAEPSAAKKPAPAAAPQKAATTKPAKATKDVVKPATGAYTLAIGEYVVGKSADMVQAKLKKLGIGPVVRTKAKRSEPMNRLYLASYDSHQAADTALANLKNATPDGFILPENGKYAVYAGSYYNEGKAAVEQDRLYEKGYKLVMKKTTAPVPVARLTAGRYASKDEAVKDIARLKKQGIAAHVVKAGK